MHSRTKAAVSALTNSGGKRILRGAQVAAETGTYMAHARLQCAMDSTRTTSAIGPDTTRPKVYTRASVGSQDWFTQ